MAKLKGNFRADWIARLRTELTSSRGWPLHEVASLNDNEVPSRYFDAQLRRITPAPRLIEIGDTFICPPKLQAGLVSLKSKVEQGVDINSHLSKGHASMTNLDGLLADWGVHHFHLGIAPDPGNPTYSGRTGPLLYALVTEDAFYVIGVYSHRDFEDQSVLEAIHRNWPELISNYRVKGVTAETLNAKERRALRNNNANVITAVADGTTYGPLTGGVMANGVNTQAVRYADYWEMWINTLQGEVETQLEKILPDLRKNGYSEELEIEAKLLEVSETGMRVLFPRYGVAVYLNVRSGGGHDDSGGP